MPMSAPNRQAVDYQVFTASGNWTKPAGAKRVVVEMWGAGGGGTAGSGGGGGYRKLIEFDAAALMDTEVVTVGLGGAVGVNGDASAFAGVQADGGGGAEDTGSFYQAGGGAGSFGGGEHGTIGGLGGDGAVPAYDRGGDGANYPATTVGGSSIWGGGGGGSGVLGQGGSSVYGGGGGGADLGGGKSNYGGWGGIGATPAEIPAGGGGTNGTTTGYPGARGEVRITTYR